MSEEVDHLPCWHLHKSLNVIAKVAHAVPLVDPVVTDITAFIVFVEFNQTEREQSTVDDFDPIVNVVGVSLSLIDSDG